MARARTSKRSPIRLNVSLTPLVDIVFLLIIFFVLVAQITRAERFELDLPQTEDGRPLERAPEARIVVNLVPPDRVADVGGAYRVGADVFQETTAGESALLAALVRALRDTPAPGPPPVHVRAQRGERFGRVHGLLDLIESAGARRVRLMTVEPDR